MDKKTLIQYVEEIALTTDIKKCLSDNDGKDSLGKSQFRSIAELCAKAVCYEEMKLLIDYKESKGNGWDKNIAKAGFKTCGEVIIEYMEKVKQQSTEEDVLKNLELFFGYMHRKANVLCKENKKEKIKDIDNSRGKGAHR